MDENVNDLRPKKARKRIKYFAPGGGRKEVVVGKRAENATPLWVECPVCGGAGPTAQRDCTCRQGYVETGFTQERFDALIKENDRMLVLLVSMVFTDLGSLRTRVNAILKGREADVEAARSRIKD